GARPLPGPVPGLLGPGSHRGAHRVPPPPRAPPRARLLGHGGPRGLARGLDHAAPRPHRRPPAALARAHHRLGVTAPRFLYHPTHRRMTPALYQVAFVAGAGLFAASLIAGVTQVLGTEKRLPGLPPDLQGSIRAQLARGELRPAARAQRVASR